MGAGLRFVSTNSADLNATRHAPSRRPQEGSGKARSRLMSRSVRCSARYCALMTAPNALPRADIGNQDGQGERRRTAHVSVEEIDFMPEFIEEIREQTGTAARRFHKAQQRARTLAEEASHHPTNTSDDRACRARYRAACQRDQSRSSCDWRDRPTRTGNFAWPNAGLVPSDAHSYVVRK